MVANSSPTPDYYTVLQVDPRADREVIDAAYRQLMKKYHPDLAGEDPRVQALHGERARAINEAYSVLRDPIQRENYDVRRGLMIGGWAGTAGAAHVGASHWHDPRSAYVPDQEILLEQPSPLVRALTAPFSALAAAYYLLPGTYEWERGSGRELLAVFWTPVLGVGAFMLATGRLAPLIGHSFMAMLAAGALLVLLSIPLWSSLPRVAGAFGPSLLLLTGNLDGLLRQAHTPGWLAWVGLGTLSLIVSTRLYVFSVLPTLLLCWLVSRLP